MARQTLIKRRGGRILVDDLFTELVDAPVSITALGIVRGNSAGTALEFYSPSAEEKEAVDGPLALTDDTVELFGIRNAAGAAKTVTAITDPSDFWPGRRLIVRVRTDVAAAATVTLSHNAAVAGRLILGDVFASATDPGTHDHGTAVFEGAHTHQNPSAPVSITVPINEIWQFEFMALDVTTGGDVMGLPPNGWELIAAPMRVV